MANFRSKRGLLHLLPFLPLDVMCEIFCFLHPADLLVLARTSKPFRAFLLKSSAAFIWRSARKNIDGLPEPPSDMNEVQYASLVFGLGCHYKDCDKKARDTVWHLRIRSCASCRSKHQPINIQESEHSLALCVLLGCYPDSLEQYIPCGPFLNPKGNPIKGFQEHHLKIFKDDLTALLPSERQAYLDHRRQVTEPITQFAKEGVAWQLDVKNVRITEMRNKRAARAEIILDNLVAAGFREEIDYFGWDRIRRHPLISSTQALTEKSRSGVLDQLREYMLGWRELRTEEQVYAIRRQIFVDAWLQFITTAFRDTPRNSPYFPLPPSATIGFSESIDTLIRQSGPISNETLVDQLHAAFFLACEYILDWHKTIRRELASLLPDYKADDNDDAIHAQLKLATSVFYCNAGRSCRAEGRPLAYPEILFHPCFTFMTQGNGPSSKDPRGIAHQKACLTMGGNPWICKGRVQVHPRRSLVNRVLSCHGQDSRSTTATAMDKLDPRMTCVQCAARDGVIVSMSWRHAVQHSIRFHPSSTHHHPWVMTCPALHARIDMVKSEHLRSSPSLLGDRLGNYFICLHCPPYIPSWNTRIGLGDLVGHIKNKHGVPSPVFGEDYAFDQNMEYLFCL